MPIMEPTVIKRTLHTATWNFLSENMRRYEIRMATFGRAVAGTYSISGIDAHCAAGEQVA